MSQTRNAPNSSSQELNTLLVKTNDLFQQTKFDKKQKDFMNAAFLLIKSLTVKVTELIDQNEKLINDKKAKDVSIKNLIKENKVTNDLIKDVSLDNTIQDDSINEIEDDINILSKRIIDSEFKKCKNKVRIDGVKYFEGDDGFESPNDTCSSFQDLLNDMNIPETKFSECHRVKKSEKINKPPSIVVKFESSLDHANFFSNLSKLPENKKIQVSQEFPVFLRRRLKQLKQIAWTERNKGFKTVIKRDSFGLRLYVKQGSAPWTKKV